MAIFNLILIVILFFWVSRIKKRFETNKKLSELAESILWNTLLEEGIVSESVYQNARDRFIRNIKPALTSEKKKQAQIKALETLLKEGMTDEDIKTVEK